jgi:hypothetical protein
MFSKGYNPGGTRKKIIGLEADIAFLKLHALEWIELSSKPTPTTAGRRGDCGVWTDGYAYLWVDTARVVSWPLRTDWEA